LGQEIAMNLSGQSAEASLVVQQSDTAEALRIEDEDVFPAVFATSRMVALMEIAAARLLRPLLKDGELSVGVTIMVSHGAATPVGCRVRAVATYQGPEGKLHRFKVQAFDDAGPIGSGEHLRAIVSTERLVSGARRRIESSGPAGAR
jgi:fluoroacetyl-CoA thioesterase